MSLDFRTLGLVGGVLAILAAATLIGRRLKFAADIGLNPALVESFNLRIRAWWLMCTILAAAFLLGTVATVVLFGLISFWALREFVTLTPTRLGDHRTLFWVFFIFTPLQYLLVGMGTAYYGLFTVLIPVYAFLFIPARVALAGDYKRFLERTAKIQAGLMICVYCLSHAPALLSLKIAGFEGQGPRLLFFFVLVVQLNDVLQYAWGKLLGQHVITPSISPSRTWEGFFGGAASTTLVGMALWWATPFEPWQAAAMSLIVAIMGSAGGMTMSAIKRDRGVKDYGTLVVGHGGVLDRIDSICFAAPVFYHLTRYFFVVS